MERLRTALEAYNVNSLQAIADTLGVVQQKPVQKNNLVNDLYRAIQMLAGSTSFLNTLSVAESVVLKQMLKLNRICTHRDIALPLIMQGLVYVRGIDATNNLPAIPAVLESLLKKGMIVNLTQLNQTGDRREFEPLIHFSIPSEVHSKLLKYLSSDGDTRISGDVVGTSVPSAINPGNLEALLRQLFFVWSELRRKPARLLKSGSIGKRDQQRIANSLGWVEDDNTPQIQLFYEMLKALNLVELEEGVVSAADSDAVTLFWSTSPVSQVREILRAYPQLDLVVEYNAKPLSAVAYYGGVQPRTHSEIRKIILGVLDGFLDVPWIPYPVFVALASGGMPGHLVLPPSSLQMLTSNLRWYGDYRKTELLEQLFEIEQQIVSTVLREMLTLGFIDEGFEQYQRSKPEVVRVSGLLRAYMTQQPWPKPQEQGQVVLQPDAQLLAMGPVPLRVLANLERVAVREKQDQSVITYRVTRDGVYRALQRGETREEIRGYLEEATSQELPQNIARSLEEWTEQHERIVLRRDIQILQVVSRELLERLITDVVASRYLHRIDDTTAWIKQKDVASVEKRLLTLEILPAHSQDRAADLENSLQWDGELLISRFPLPSLYVIDAMQLIAENGELDGEKFSWSLTEKSIGRAIVSGVKIEDIVKMVESMTGTALSQDWNKKLKVWGKYYKDAYTAQVRLIRLESIKVMQELRDADGRLKQWLHPLSKSEALLVVNHNNWEDTLALLASYGILVREEEWW